MLDAHLRQFLETSDSSKQNIFPLFHHILYRHETNQQLKIQIYVTNFFLGKAECNYSYRVLFLTVPPNFQYQNENRWAANQRFCSMKFSTYKISSLVEKRFSFLHWNLGGTVKKAPCRNLISQRNTYCIWIRKWKVRNNPTLPVCSTFPDKYRKLGEPEILPWAPSNPSLCQLYCLRVCLK